MLSLIPMYLQSAIVLAPLVLIIGIGVFWGKKDYPFAGPFVTMLVTSVTTPALVFKTFSTTQIGASEMVSVLGATVLGIVLCMALCAVVLKVIGMPVRAMLQLASFPNAGNLGLPISYLAYGDVGLSTAVAFFAIVSFLTHTVGVRTLPNTQGVGSWKSPILLACATAIGLRVFSVPVPDVLLETAGMLGACTVPLMLLSLGHALALIPRTSLRAGAVVGVIRLAVGALVGYGMIGLLPLPAAVGGTLALQLSMPCAVVSYMYVRRFTDMHDVAAGAVLVSTVTFLLYVPVLILVAR
ncbi:MAG: AEC family transporter [Burkholderiaceae bacterium]|nr:AEC family transporter [Burkholderiaceae bacterium]